MEPPFEPSGVTKPIQLLSAWLIGLVLINSSFLAAASQISNPPWGAGALVVAAILNVPIFLICLFVLQTKFRPEMQEDSFYYKYLERRYSAETRTTELVEVQTPKEPARQTPPISRVRAAVKKLQMTSAVAEQRGFVIQINDLLPHYLDIIEALRMEALAPDGTFGSTSDEPEVPDPIILTAGRGAPVEIFQKILRALEPFHIDGVSLARKDINDKQIYIGSYTYRLGKQTYRQLTQSLRQQLLRDQLSQSEFESILSEGTRGPED